jgi:hypothetical protein
MALVRAIVQGDRGRVSGLLAVAPDLALARFALGATRQAAEEYFLHAIQHYVYGGDSALHIAAAAFDAGIVRELVDAQRETVLCLIELGADPNARDKNAAGLGTSRPEAVDNASRSIEFAMPSRVRGSRRAPPGPGAVPSRGGSGSSLRRPQRVRALGAPRRRTKRSRGAR